MLLRASSTPLEMVDREELIVLPGDVLVRVRACGVCRADVDIADGVLPVDDFPLVPGHEVIGVVEDIGDGVTNVEPNDRVGIPRLGHTCGTCAYCTSGREHLCADARFTGYQSDGGFAEYVVADARYAVKIPDAYTDADAAPLLCGGVLGYRAYRMTGEGRHLGIYGDDVAAGVAAQVATYEGRSVWVGAAETTPPARLDAAIVCAPSGALIAEALSHVAPGGIVVCAGAHKSDVPSFSYERLGGGRGVRSVDAVTRQDLADFLAIAPKIPVKVRVQRYTLGDANRALNDVRAGRVRGAAVLEIDS